MNGKGIIGIGIVIVMGIIIFAVVFVMNMTLNNLDAKCDACGDNCRIASCLNDTASKGRIFIYALVGIFLISAAGVIFFSFKKEDEPQQQLPQDEQPREQPNEQPQDPYYGNYPQTPQDQPQDPQGNDGYYYG